MKAQIFYYIFLACTALLGCSDTNNDDSDANNGDSLPSYYGQAKAIVDARCATCHQAGDIGPFPLTTYQEVTAFAGVVRASIVNDTMPPWQPSDDCNNYLDNYDLTLEEKDILLAWLDGGAPEGEPGNEPMSSSPLEEAPFEADVSLELPEPYTPTVEPDDHRCQLLPWPEQETRYVTGIRVTPDQRAIVHHVIVFVISADQVTEYQAYADAEEGPGYTCFGGPTPVTEGGTMGVPNIPRQIGFWVPGVRATPFPAGTGIRVEPGSMLVVQMHYNTSTAAPVADQSVIEIATTEAVEREATIVQVLDLGWVTDGQFGGDPMTIPAGDEDVAHDTSVAFN